MTYLTEPSELNATVLSLKVLVVGQAFSRLRLVEPSAGMSTQAGRATAKELQYAGDDRRELSCS